MVAAHALIAVVVGVLSVLLLWSTSPVLAFLIAPFIASTAVLAVAVVGAAFQRKGSASYLAAAE